MLNRAPIFVLGFQRGGTNILVNLLSSHGDTQRLGAEIHEVFYGRHGRPVTAYLKRALAAPVFMASSPHVLWPYRYHDRAPLPRLAAHYADAIFYANRWTRYRSEDRPEGARGQRDRARARLVAKGVNGVVFASSLLRAMYPDARFVALIRDGYALSESWIRRGWDAERSATVYQAVCDRIAEDAARWPNYHVIRFEDLVRDPLRELSHVYSEVGLGSALPAHLKLQAKASMDASGAHRLHFGSRDREIVWVPTERLREYLRADVNQDQVRRLTDAQREVIGRIAGRALLNFGYA
ncbi:MAG: sulfotransferase [Trueperaceae bacterium]